jgi:hypothetical protein
VNAYLEHIYRDLRELEQSFIERTASDDFDWSATYALCDLFDYEVVNLPPAEFLVPDQKRALLRRIETLLKMISVFAPIPLHLDVDKKYRLFRKVWEQKIVLFEQQSVGRMKFCAGVLEECSFGSHNCICGAKFNEEDSDLNQKQAP